MRQGAYLSCNTGRIQLQGLREHGFSCAGLVETQASLASPHISLETLWVPFYGIPGTTATSKWSNIAHLQAGVHFCSAFSPKRFAHRVTLGSAVNITIAGLPKDRRAHHCRIA